MSSEIIPKIVYLTWWTKDLPEFMSKSVNLLKTANPDFRFELFDDSDCEKFIEDNFEPNVLMAYKNLIPGAYRADLWRYCVLYKTGGVYIDIKFHPKNGFFLRDYIHKEYFVKDNPKAFGTGKWVGIYNGFMITKACCPMMLEAINMVVKNSETHYFGSDLLDITGPSLLGRIYKNYYSDYDSMLFRYINGNICMNGISVLSPYSVYILEKKVSPYNHYSALYSERRVYKDQCGEIDINNIAEIRRDIKSDINKGKNAVASKFAISGSRMLFGKIKR